MSKTLISRIVYFVIAIVFFGWLIITSQFLVEFLKQYYLLLTILVFLFVILGLLNAKSIINFFDKINKK